MAVRGFFSPFLSPFSSVQLFIIIIIIFQTAVYSRLTATSTAADAN